jgi:hypothetical protein
MRVFTWVNDLTEEEGRSPKEDSELLEEEDISF